MPFITTAIDWVERGWVPDFLTRAAIRRLCRQRLLDCGGRDCEVDRDAMEAFLASMRLGPVAPVPERANEQHYEVPPDFFGAVLGPHRKYSCCLWNDALTLADAESASLAETCRRAELVDGQDILELGCGWGSLSLWMAERYPSSRVTAVSNSRPQREYIEGQARVRGLANLRVLTEDMNRFVAPGEYDRVVSVEMFEHMRNYSHLLKRIHGWLRPGGKLFVHIFCHRVFAYPFETDGEDNWMGKWFFTGGIMPSDDLFARFQDDLRLERQWRWNGVHYQRTAEAWLDNLDRRRDDVLPVLRATYGESEAVRWFYRWRMFFLAVSELFGYRGGEEWFVGHYRFTRPEGSGS